MWNFFKTLLAIFVALLSYFYKNHHNIKYYWIAAAVISMIWNYYWDIYKDFLFFQKNSRNKVKYIKLIKNSS